MLVISVAHLIHDIYSSFLAPLLPMLIEKFSLSLSAAGLLSVFARIPSLFNPLIGLIADRIKIRYFIIFSPLVTSISMSLLGLAPNYVALVTLLFIMGLSAACFHVPAPVMTRHVSGNKVGLGMSCFMVGGELARSLGPLVILGAVWLWGLGGTYWLIWFGVLATALLYWRLHDIKISDDFRHRKADHPSPGKTLKQARRVLIVIFGISLCTGLMKASLTVFLPTYLHIEGGSFWQGGIYLAIIQFAGVLGLFVMGSYSDKIGRRTSLIITVVITPVLMWVFCKFGCQYPIPILIGLGFFLFAPGPVFLAAVQDIRSARPAFINSIYMTISFVVGSVTVMLVGMMGDRIGLEKTFQIAAGVAFLAIPFALALPEKIDGGEKTPSLTENGL